jgi:hypothetical protein
MTQRTLVALVAGLFVGSVSAAQSYSSLAKLPDWSGYWRGGPPGGVPQGSGLPGAGGPPPAGAPARSRPPLNTAAQARMDEFSQPGVDPGNRERYCSPFRFVGSNASFTGFDVVFSPGRVTILNEEGLIRRIYTDGRKASEDGVESLGGSSTGHWEGDTLVVETIDIDHTASYPGEIQAGASPIGSNAKILERLRLIAKDSLQIETTIIAPELLTAPFKSTQVLQRDLEHTPIQRTGCVKNDRLVDPVTGFQRFDLTPPADIPPPPP